MKDEMIKQLEEKEKKESNAELKKSLQSKIKVLKENKEVKK